MRNWANDSFQTSNYTEEIRAAGLRAPNLMKKIWDVNGAIGGPVRQDKLWFFTAARYRAIGNGRGHVQQPERG